MKDNESTEDEQLKSKFVFNICRQGLHFVRSIPPAVLQLGSGTSLSSISDGHIDEWYVDPKLESFL